ncbi:hypothetical protein WKI71_43955 [Streptomyces sp. MS1.AVA.1]|uniref:Uncharacterized protein n=1 Tax=Streptomyces machairae TaxID=3134109 RepID=A0ABU8UV56_9ACTN
MGARAERAAARLDAGQVAAVVLEIEGAGGREEWRRRNARGGDVTFARVVWDSDAGRAAREA